MCLHSDLSSQTVSTNTIILLTQLCFHMSVQHSNCHKWLDALSYLYLVSYSMYTYGMPQIHAFKSMLYYHKQLLLVTILNDVISPGNIPKYCMHSGFICMLKIQFGVRKLSDYNSKKKK